MLTLQQIQELFDANLARTVKYAADIQLLENALLLLQPRPFDPDQRPRDRAAVVDKALGMFREAMAMLRPILQRFCDSRGRRIFTDPADRSITGPRQLTFAALEQAGVFDQPHVPKNLFADSALQATYLPISADGRPGLRLSHDQGRLAGLWLDLQPGRNLVCPACGQPADTLTVVPTSGPWLQCTDCQNTIPPVPVPAGSSAKELIDA
jgi:hypothetical protein